MSCKVEIARPSVNLEQIVSDYIAKHREAARRELRSYSVKRTLEEAIREAALCHLPSGKRHSHQRRIPERVLRSAERRLQAAVEQLSKAGSFAELHTLVEGLIGGIHGIGALTVYDVTHRIGGYLGLSPHAVYLHSGTRTGARHLGLQGKELELEQLPSEFHVLTPAEAEDCLCIYKGALARLGNG